ncbi:hypothetical protein GYMLUDRAFT_87846 [Collybiopsis luxurians FD-317 M1]|uniref:Unplaced genomic scaffold GYMLUscaffold_63, whole genome shotgun sequence n=1 Tax=Collybiopsis luxurians FD-317 M1 TaxID=944289 RepID=A0A0D0BYH5_9AGAR|nr:hypothetical protein GYMLUDRAFT_87846 [Collybiopsis luxurians FD-317 M1]
MALHFALLIAAYAFIEPTLGTAIAERGNVLSEISSGVSSVLGDVTSFVSSVQPEVTSDASSILSDATSFVTSVQSEISSGASSVYGDATSYVASAFGATVVAPGVIETLTSDSRNGIYTIVTSQGGEAITLTDSPAGRPTTFAGHVFTAVVDSGNSGNSGSGDSGSGSNGSNGPNGPSPSPSSSTSTSSNSARRIDMGTISSSGFISCVGMVVGGTLLGAFVAV